MKKVNKVKNNDMPLTVTIGEMIDKAVVQKSVTKANHKIDNIIKNTKTLSSEELKKQSEQNYANKVAADEALVAAYKENKLKSEALIKEAQALIKAKEKAVNKTASKEKKEVKATE